MKVSRQKASIGGKGTGTLGERGARGRSNDCVVVQGMGGLMSVTGEPDGERGGGPVKVGVAISDVIAGFNALASILTALVQRERTGRGEYIDVALLDCTVAALINQASTYLVAGTVPGRMGNAHPTVVPYQAFRTADGYIIVAVGNDALRRGVARGAGGGQPLPFASARNEDAP
jgi:crotonobetainyl-CoA:carnitine CoA-transferase CaiB-like acyl-CoA transferase